MAQLGKIVLVHSLGITGVQLIAFGDVLLHAGIGLTEKSLVEIIAETLGGLLHLLLDFLVHLGYQVFDEHIGAIAFLGVLIVDKRVVKGIDVDPMLSRWSGA